MHTRASNSELVEPLPEPERTLNRRLRRRNMRVPFEQRNEPPTQPKIIYALILDINNFRHFLDILKNCNPMDDEPMWAADCVVVLTPGFAITIPETANKIAIKEDKSKDTRLAVYKFTRYAFPFSTGYAFLSLTGYASLLKALDTQLKKTKVKSNEAKVKHDIDVIETINIELEHKVAKLLKENETLKRHYKEMFDSIKTTRAKNIEHTTSLIANNDKFKAQLQEKGFAIAALKNELRKLTGNSVNTKFAKSSILGKPALQPRRNQSVVRQPTAFKSERPRISKQRFASQVDVNNDLSKPVTTHYLPKERESAVAKPHHMIAPGSSRYSSNDMVHNHYLEEAKKKTQESSRNSEPSVMPSARSQSTTNGSKPKPRINNQKSRNWPASKSSCVTTKTVPIAEHSRNSRSFSDSKHFVCSTCQKCVFNANHDHCVTKFQNEVNSRAKVETTGKIFKTISLRWVPTGKIFTSSITKVDSKPTNGSNEDITNQYECEQTLDVSEGTLNLSAGTSFNPKKEELRVCSKLGIHDHNNEPSSSKLVLKVVPPADKTATSRQELVLLFHHHITMLSPIPAESDSSPRAHAQTTKTYYKHQVPSIKKAQDLKTKTSENSYIKDNSS
ncbi:hypothetical protein Tco_1294195 [Tanacetum coccineum]